MSRRDADSEKAHIPSSSVVIDSLFITDFLGFVKGTFIAVLQHSFRRSETRFLGEERAGIEENEFKIRYTQRRDDGGLESTYATTKQIKHVFLLLPSPYIRASLSRRVLTLHWLLLLSPGKARISLQ